MSALYMSGLFTLLLSANDTSSFVTTTLKCKDTMYTFQKEAINNVGLSNKGTQYYTTYNNLDELTKELNRQCGVK